MCAAVGKVLGLARCRAAGGLVQRFARDLLGKAVFGLQVFKITLELVRQAIDIL